MQLTRKQIADAFAHYAKPATYKKLKAVAEQQLTQWRDASGPMMPDVPHRKWLPVDEPVKWVKKPDKYSWLNALDDSGRVVFARSEPLDYKGDDFAEYVYDCTDEGIWIAVYWHSGQELGRLIFYRMDGGRCLGITEFKADRKAFHFEFEWAEGRLVKVVVHSLIDKADEQAAEPTYEYVVDDRAVRSIYEMSYGDDGKLDRLINRLLSSDGRTDYGTTSEYQRMPKGMTRKKLIDAVEQMLVEQIAELIESAELKDPICAALVQFTGVDTDTTGYPPPVFLVTPSARAALAENMGADGLEYVWSIAELQGQDGVIEMWSDDELLTSYLELIFQLTIAGKSGSYKPVRDMFQRVCAELNTLKWAKKRQVTDDFVVLPRDMRGEMDMMIDVKACIPQPKLKLLVKGGLLPDTVLK